MNLIREFIRNCLLNEGKKEDIFRKYPNFKDEIEFFIQNDLLEKLSNKKFQML
jgi:hypothetical protein